MITKKLVFPNDEEFLRFKELTYNEYIDELCDMRINTIAEIKDFILELLNDEQYINPMVLLPKLDRLMELQEVIDINISGDKTQ